MAKPDTLQASEHGQICIKTKIKQRGLSADSPEWSRQAAELLQEKGLSEGGSSSTWRRFISGRSINAISFEVFCKILLLEVQDVAELSTDNPYALNEKSIEREYFASYKSPRVIDELWSDPTEDGYIKVHVKNESLLQDNYLSIKFIRLAGGVNFTIRPENELPIDASKFECFTFKLRSPRKKLIGVRVRIVDRNCVCWLYGENYLISEKEGLSSQFNSWSKDIEISLIPNNWKHFPYDGYQQKKDIDLSKIYLISFEVGCEPENKILNDLYGFIPNQEEEEIHLSTIKFRRNSINHSQS